METLNMDYAGKICSDITTHGEFNRYATYAVYTRFGGIEWLTTDAEQQDEFGLPTVIRQSASRGEAYHG